MHYFQYAALAASLVSSASAIRGFNTGNINTAGVAKSQSDFEAEFTNQKGLDGTDGSFNSARLYTMIQGDTPSDPISAIPAAISTHTGLLLGMWASAGQDAFNLELDALRSAISTYGASLAPLVQGISVGSEDLYRITPTGIENKAGIGAGPDVVSGYIQQVRAAIKGTALANAPIGHVDTWTAWVNGSNSGVVDDCDFLGVDAYPYYQTVNTNPIQDAGSLFYAALDNTRAHANGKPVWVTETGWPVSGPVEGEAVASVANARSYWEQVYCTLPSDVNLYWYTQADADQASGVGSFGVVGSTLSTTPLYSLSCSNTTHSSDASASSASSSATYHSATKVSSGDVSSKTMATVVSGYSGTSTSTATGTAVVYPMSSGVATGTGVAPGASASSTVTPFNPNGASTAQVSLALLAVPAILALLA